MNVLWALNRMDLGGIESYTTKVLPLLKQHFSVALLLTEGGGRLVDKITQADIPFHQLTIRGTLNRKSIVQAARFLRQLSPHIVHSHNFRTHYNVRIASILANVPAIIPHFHSMPGERFTPKTLRWEKILLPATDRVLFVTPPAQRQYLNLLQLPPHSPQARKLVTLPNALPLHPFYHVDQQRVASLRESYHLDIDSPVVGIIARIAPVKCIEVLIEAIRLLIPKFPAIRCLIVGDGEPDYVTSLTQLVREKNLSSHILFTGYREDVAEHIQLFTLGVLCSSHEGLPLFLIEAFASGCPVVASDLESIRLVMTEGKQGLFAKPNDPAALASTIETLLSNPSLRQQLGQNALRTSRTYDIQHYLTKLCNLYEEILSTRDKKTACARTWFRLKYRLKL